jgi:hypothetical protein
MAARGAIPRARSRLCQFYTISSHMAAPLPAPPAAIRSSDLPANSTAHTSSSAPRRIALTPTSNSTSPTSAPGPFLLLLAVPSRRDFGREEARPSPSQVGCAIFDRVL